jgi:hypothetical protein
MEFQATFFAVNAGSIAAPPHRPSLLLLETLSGNALQRTPKTLVFSVHTNEQEKL